MLTRITLTITIALYFTSCDSGSGYGEQSDCSEIVDSATILFEQGKYQDVIALTDWSTCDSASDQKLMSLRAESYLELQKYPEAIALYSEIIQGGNASATDFENRGRAYDAMANYDEAIANYSYAVLLDSTLTRPRFNTAAILRKEQRYSEATDELDKLLSMGFKEPYVYSEYGLIYANQEKYEEAAAAYELGLSVDTMSILAYNYSITLYNLGEYKKSLVLMDAAIRRSPKNELCYYNRAYIKLKLNDRDGACHDLAIAGELGLDVTVDQKNECTADSINSKWSE